ncbi:MAG: LPXTG cell wall anchor domain-containing protein [Acidimicrobiales bacterium]|nr:MAG: LPXTG cell wall anchor domain-containing protein [Acidimicrobiales bacterium]
MRKFLAILMATLMASVFMAGAAGAQDPVVGSMTPDPASVPEAGDYEITATVTGMIPDSTVLMSVCTAPGDTLVPGVSSADDIAAAAAAISPLEHCDVANAVTVQVDSAGGFTQAMSVTIGDNTFFSAGALDGSQIAGTWVPVVDAETAAAIAAAQAEAAELAVTGTESTTLALFGAALLMLGAAAVYGSRRFETV